MYLEIFLLIKLDFRNKNSKSRNRIKNHEIDFRFKFGWEINLLQNQAYIKKKKHKIPFKKLKLTFINSLDS